MARQILDPLLQALFVKYKDIDIAWRIFLEQVGFFRDKKKRQEKEEEEEEKKEKTKEGEKAITRSLGSVNVDQLGLSGHALNEVGAPQLGGLYAKTTSGIEVTSLSSAAPLGGYKSKLTGETRGARGRRTTKTRGRSRGAGK